MICTARTIAKYLKERQYHIGALYGCEDRIYVNPAINIKELYLLKNSFRRCVTHLQLWHYIRKTDIKLLVFKFENDVKQVKHTFQAVRCVQKNI